ncbi:MAG: hypothetical protein ACYCSS_15110, partial [Sulfuriferula sp.]
IGVWSYILKLGSWYIYGLLSRCSLVVVHYVHLLQIWTGGRQRVVMHGSWRSTNCRRRRQFLVCKKAGILAVKVEKPSLVNVIKEMASSSFAA